MRRNWFDTSIGKKCLVALSGLILLGFVMGHLAGNLMIYGGPTALNGYAKKLRELSPLLWGVRLGLALAVLVHIWMSIRVTRENAAARPVRYRNPHTQVTTTSAKTMWLSGLFVVAYLVYHLLHFTFRVAHPELSRVVDPLGHVDVYAMVVRSFQQWPISFAYLIGMALLCLHLSHGIGSALHTLGLTSEGLMPVVAWMSRLIALVIFLGYMSIPAAVLTGVLKLP